MRPRQPVRQVPPVGAGSLLGRWAQPAALGLAFARAGLGLAALVTPSAVALPWVGEDVGGVTATVLGRAVGDRDLALAVGSLRAARCGRPLRGWVEAGAAADLVDAAATLVSFGHLPRRTRWFVLASAAGAGAAGAVVARCL